MEFDPNSIGCCDFFGKRLNTAILKKGDNSRPRRDAINRVSTKSKGMTFIEIMVASLIVAILAAVSFPIYHIIQQRERENRLKSILLQVRSSIWGGGAGKTVSNQDFFEGYRPHVVQQINNWPKPPLTGNAANQKKQKGYAIATATALGTLFPFSPSRLEKDVGHSYLIPFDWTESDPLKVNSVTINQRFIRRVPPVPFKNAFWEFKVATDSRPGSQVWFASDPNDPWATGEATGVIDIRCVGAGLGLNGTQIASW